MSSGRKLMQLRKRLGLTQKQVADAVGVTDQTVSNWEAGRHIPKLYPAQMKMLCDLLNLTLEELAEWHI
ncbi:MAG: helix-turn-helix transcriptional regulator [Coleofasciculus sp. D1-CHI-01]|uniref:helix-turn-helix transcriptional regulator n=1 Tax=Coleofasciculus sp. D1-CHI-01 TaxID=3068482 RepID=UPI0032FC8B6C